MTEESDAASIWPDFPEFDEELVENCRRSNDYRPMLYEWFRFSAMLCNSIALVDHKKSPAIVASERLGTVVCGLMVRASRLSLANLCLHSERRFGDSSPILSRSIQETCIRISWLLESDSEGRLKRYLADGLKADLKFKRTIDENIRDRGGDALPIEARMLESISKCLDECGLTEQTVLDTKKMPPLLEQLPDGDWKDEVYDGVQRMGSHAVHGTWTNLISFYLDSAEGEALQPCFDPHEPHHMYFISDSLLILRAVKDWARTCVGDEKLRDLIFSHTVQASDEIRALGLAGDEHLRDLVASNIKNRNNL